MNPEIQFDLTDYSFELNSEKETQNKDLLLSLNFQEDCALHPLARKSQPSDWSMPFQFENSVYNTH
jgi:hypothetical protein